MIIYKLELYEIENGSKGFEYFEKAGDAKEARDKHLANHPNDIAAEKFTTINKLDIPVTKDGMLDALNIHGGHPDNG